MNRMNRMNRTMRTIGTAAAVLAAVGVLAPVGADAAPQGAPPPAVTATASGQILAAWTNCDGSSSVGGTPGSLTVARGATSGTISVDVTYGGTLQPGTDFDGTLPDPVVIPAGDDAVSIPIDANAAGTLTLTVEPGDGYTVGDPATATFEASVQTLTSRCEPVQVQTIQLGEAPDYVDLVLDLGIFASALVGTHLVVDGELPPGLTASGLPGEGATELGVYEFSYSWCYDVGYCALTIPYRITVVDVEGGAPVLPGPSPDPAPPAAAVPGTADYTG